MQTEQFIEYLESHFGLDGVSLALIRNIIEYARSQFKDIGARKLFLEDMLDAKIGFTPAEIDLAAGERAAAETREGDQEEEMFYRVNKERYLHIQRIDDGFDFTFYDAATKREIDGGVIEGPDLSTGAAAREVCDYFDVEIGEMVPVGTKLPEEFIPQAQDYQQEHFVREDNKLRDTDTKLDEYPVPDASMDPEALRNNGCSCSDLFPVSPRVAESLAFGGVTIFAVSPGRLKAVDRGEIGKRLGDSVLAVRRKEWESTPAFAIAVNSRMLHQEERERAFLGHSGDSFAIYQLKETGDAEVRCLRSISLDSLRKKGLQPNKANYELAYTGELPENWDLEKLWYQFNMDHPADYLRPSMSVSDIVAIRENGAISCYYVDPIGFQELSDFL